MRKTIRLLFVILAMNSSVSAQDQVAAEPVEGLRDQRPREFALTGATVVIAPGNVVENTTILISDTTILDVRDPGEIPPGFKVVDLSGKMVYPGLIDAWSEVDVPRGSALSEAGYWNRHISPEIAAGQVAAKQTGPIEKLRSQGVTVRLVAPSGGILKGRSAVVLLDNQRRGRTLLKTGVWQHAQLTVPKDRRNESYPNSPMGAVALLRQALHDAAWYAKAWEAYRASDQMPRPETNTDLAALSTAIGGETFVFDAQNDRMALRADAIAKEFSLQMIVRGSGQEYRQLDAFAATRRPILLPVHFPSAPEVSTAAEAKEITLSELMHWHFAPENPARLSAAGVTICLTTDGLEDPAKFLEQVRVAVARGLPAARALAALTTTPAQLLGIDSRAGTIQPGKLANLVVTDGDLFDKKTKVLSTWVAGQEFPVTKSKQAELDAVAGHWELSFMGKAGRITIEMQLQRKAESLSGKLTSKTSQSSESNEQAVAPLRQLVRTRDRITALVSLSKLDDQFSAGESALNLVTIDSRDDRVVMLGSIIFPDGRRQAVEVKPIDEAGKSDSTPAESTEETKEESEEEPPTDEVDETEQPVAQIERVFPLGAYGLSAPITEAPGVMFRGATVWTCDAMGVLEQADVLVQDGRIVAVGPQLSVPPGCQTIEARDKHLTPGLIDCHSHMATDGGINESGQAVTAEVRIGDFLDNSDINIYRQLAGGLTAANILHGSANPIGGQNQVIKLRWGGTMDELRMAEAPAGIKFALGENVKRNQSRYPNTRMGVEQLLRDQFLAAREYEAHARRWNAGDRSILPPRVDLQLEAIAEIHHGRRWIHCHSYRQDEILATLDVLEEFGVQIGTLQHILEGYKVADRMAQHGAMGSSFSDWWAYKFEVYDAIPFNGALMHQQGVVVSFNSDDRELARRLNTEAAKATKYGGVSEEEALKFVTLNPAKQLRIDSLVGSIAQGKQADLVLWSGPPLSTTSRCEQTWIDGRLYFDRQRDAELRERDARWHAQLVQMAIGKQDRGEKSDKPQQEADRWLRYDEFCGASGDRRLENE